MCTDRRDFLRLSAGFAGASLFAPKLAYGNHVESEPPQQSEIPTAIRNLQRMTEGIQPITLEERRGRIDKARALMKQNRVDAIVLDPGSSMF